MGVQLQGLQGLRTLIVDGNTEHRSRLRQALASIVFKGKIEQSRSESDALTALEDAKEPFHCIFVSSALHCSSIGSFISKAQGFESGSLSAFIISLAPEHVTSADVAKFYLEGAQGFISEPYSAQEIQELVNLALTQKEKERKDLELRTGAVDILAAEAVQIIDDVAQKTAQGKSAHKEKRDMSRATSRFRETSETLPVWELEKILFRRFLDAEIPKGYQPRRIAKQKSEVVLHPGAIISKIMKDRRLSEERIRANLKMDQAVFDAILEGSGSVDETMAREISRIFGHGYNYWLDAQKKYDQKKAEDEALK